MSKIKVNEVEPCSGSIFYVTGTLSASANLYCAGNTEVGGNLTVYGTTTTIDTTNMVVEDPLLVLAKNVTGTPSYDAGFVVERGSNTNAAFIWDESEDEFVVASTTETGTTAGNITISSYASFHASNIYATGSVGIGTTSPSSALEVEGSSGDLTIEIDNNATNSANLKITSGAGNNRIDMVANALTGNPLALADTTITMKDQRVGIMTTSPEYTLDVVGNGRFTGNLIVSGTLDAHVADFKVTADTMTFGDASGDTVTFNASTVSTPNGLNFDSNTLVIDASNNRIGIGTASPASTLEIEGSSGDLIIEIDNNASNSANFQIQNGAGNARVDMVMNDGSASTTITMKDQKVGILDTSPSYTLDVNGTLRAVSAATFDAGVTSTAASNTLGATSFNDANITNIGDIACDSVSPDTDATGLQINFTSADTGDSKINLTDNLANALDITESSVSYLKFVTTNSSEGVVVGKALTVAAGGLSITTGGATVTAGGLTVTEGDVNIHSGTLFVDDSENKVGIGTTSPSSTFEIEGSSGDLILEIDNNASNSANFQIQNGAGNARVDMVMNDGSANTTITMKGQKVGINDTTPSYTLDVAGNGRFTGEVYFDDKVGIGTTSPGVPLEVQDTTTSSATQGGNLRLSANDGAVMGSGHRLGVLEFAGAEDTSDTITVGARIEALTDAAWSASENGPDLLFYTTDGNASQSEQMRITATGKVGIGISSPTQLFHVEGAMVQDWVSRIKNTHSTSGQSYGLQVIAGTNSSDVAFTVKNQANSATYLEVQGDGNIGIGVSDPDTTLEVFKAGTQLKLSYDGTYNTTFAVDSGGDLTITPSGGDVYLATGTKLRSTNADLLLYGDVGINTAVPSVELDVTGDVRISGNLRVEGGISKTAATSDVASGSGAVTSNNVGISHTLTTHTATSDGARHADVTVTNSKVETTSTIIGTAGSNVDVHVHTIADGSFKYAFTNRTGGSITTDSEIVFNFVVM